MCAHAEKRREILARVADLLRLVGADEDAPFVVRIAAVGESGEKLSIEIEPPGWPAAAQTQAQPKGLHLSHLERRIVDYLTGRGDDTAGEKIAEALSESHQHRFKAILTNLVDRGILDVGSKGYRLAP